MMNIIRGILVASLLVITICGGGNIRAAGITQIGMEKPINNTIAHLEAAMKAVDAKDVAMAQEHIKAAGQSSKDIIGGSLEVKAQRGSRAIKNARRQIDEGNTAAAVDSLTEALEVFKSLLQPLEPSSRGGLK